MKTTKNLNAVNLSLTEQGQVANVCRIERNKEYAAIVRSVWGNHTDYIQYSDGETESIENYTFDGEIMVDSGTETYMIPTFRKN